MTVDLEAVRAAVAPLLTPLGLELYDVELTGSGRSRVVRVSVDRPGGTGVDVGALADATHAVEHAVEDAVEGTFQLEVSSPGLERKLARPEHFRSALGSEISVKYRDDGVATRLRGRLTDVDDATIRVTGDDGTETAITRDAIVAARTVFEWGPQPRTAHGTASRPKEATRS
jgi:ribosome maturation factor RimP